jgi:hypothetical protein
MALLFGFRKMGSKATELVGQNWKNFSLRMEIRWKSDNSLQLLKKASQMTGFLFFITHLTIRRFSI